MSRRIRNATLLLVLMVCATCAVAGGQAAAAEAIEYRVKAAFLLNFTKFTEWPTPEANKESPITICLVGEDPFGSTLDQIVEGEVVDGRKIVVQRVAQASKEACQIAYFSKSEKGQARALEAIGQGVLTVGEGQEFLRQGGMIGFVLDNRRVRFDVRQSAVRGGGLKLSSRLLGVARTVEK